MSILSIKCPACDRAGGHQRVSRSEYSPVAPVMLGGVLFAWVFDLSRKPRFRCGQCGEVFSAHTLLSRLFLGIFIWIVLALLVGLVGLLFERATR